MKKRIISFVLTIMLLIGTALTGTVSVSAYEGNYCEPKPYVPSAGAQEVGFNRYYFLLPNDWKNSFTDSAGAYWWSGTDACDVSTDSNSVQWPGYKMNQYDAKEVTMGSVTGTVWYLDVPADVLTIVFNNALDGGDPAWDNFDKDRYSSAYQTMSIASEYYDPGENVNYPDGTDSFNNMIYIIDPDKTSENAEGNLVYTGEWYYYHGGDKFDTQANPVYGGVDGEKPIMPEKEPTTNKFYFEVPDSWTVNQMYAHVWMCIDDGSVQWPAWKTKAEKMTDEGNGIWSYDLSQAGYIDPYKGGAYAVIFVSDTNMQTYNLVFGADCLGDTAYVTGNTFKNPEDSNKTCIEARWSNGKYGPEKKILSSGDDVVGDTVPAGATDATLMANWLKAYYADYTKTRNICPLLEKLNVTGEEVYNELEKLVENDLNKDVILDKVSQLLLESTMVESIEVIKIPAYKFITGNDYYINYDYLYGMEVKITYSDGTEETYDYDDWNFFENELKYSGECVKYDEYGECYISPASGENVITVTYGGKSTDFTITGLEVKSIDVVKIPDKKFIIGYDYYIYNNYRLSGMKVKVTYSDDTTATYSYDEDVNFFNNELEFSGDCLHDYHLNLSLGENVITVTYGGKSTDFTITGLEVKSIDVVKIPDKKFIIGYDYYIYDGCLYGMEVKITYSDGTEATYNYNSDWDLFENELSFSGECFYESSNEFVPALGENIITVTYGGKSADFTIQGLKEIEEKIEITKLPDKKFLAGNQYYLNNDYLSGMEVKVTNSDGSVEKYSYDESWYLFVYDLNYSGECVKYDEDGDCYITPALGENVITVTYNGKSADFTLIGYEVENIEVTKFSSQIKFVEGYGYYLSDFFDGMEVTISYSDGTEEVVAYNDNRFFFDYELEISGDGIDYYSFIPALGENVITLTYGNKTTEFTIEGIGVESIEVTKAPDKKFMAGTEYYVSAWNNFFNGMEVEVSYSDGTSKVYNFGNTDEVEVREFFDGRLALSGDCVYDGSSIIPAYGENVITAEYGGKSADFTIIGLGIKSIEVTNTPANRFVANVMYSVSELCEGMEVKVTYSDDTTEVYSYEENPEFFDDSLKYSGDCLLDEYTFIPVLGDNTFTVTCGDKSADFTITSIGVESIEITNLPYNTEFVVSEEDHYYIPHYLSGMEVKVTYSDGSEVVYSYDEDSDFFYDKLNFAYDLMDEYGNFIPVLGENVITVIYGGKSTEFTVTGIREYNDVLGDVDGDGVLGIKDAAYLQLYLAELVTDTELNLYVADVNNDGDINIVDAAYIQLICAGLTI